MNLTQMDFVLFALNLVLFAYLLYMYINTRKIVVSGYIGSTKFIAIVFIVFAFIPLFTNMDIFTIIRSVLIATVGIMYSLLKSGISNEGFVIMGTLYPWRKISNIEKDKKEKYRVGFYIKRMYRYIEFKVEEKEQIDAILNKYQRKQY